MPVPSTYQGVKVCEGECLKPLPTELQKAAGAIHLQRCRHKFAPQPECPQLRAKLIVVAGSHYKQKPPRHSSAETTSLGEGCGNEKGDTPGEGECGGSPLGSKKEANYIEGRTPALRMHIHKKSLVERG